MRLRKSGLSSRRVGGDLVVLDLEQSRYVTIRGSGVYLFDLLQEEQDREALVAALLAKFDVDEDTARRDVDAFVTQLVDASLLSA